MDPNQHLVLIKGEDLTRDVVSCSLHPRTRRVEVTFQGGKTYSYSPESVVWLKHPAELDPMHHWVYRGAEKLEELNAIQVFASDRFRFIRLTWRKGQSACLPAEKLQIVASCLMNEPSRSLLDYLRKIADIMSLRSEDGTAVLGKAYEKASFIQEDSVFACLADPGRYGLPTHPSPDAIYPFGVNASQMKAVERALTNKISVIQGPPGTGKTQTILNILANLVIEQKTIQVVANNNSATENVLEKLSKPEYNLGFLVASLGKSENRGKFIENQNGGFPTEFASWQLPQTTRFELRHKINVQSQSLKRVFQIEETRALLQQQERALKLENSHFDTLLRELGLVQVSLRVRKVLTASQLLRVLQRVRHFLNRGNRFSVWFRIWTRWFLGIGDGRFFSRPGHELEALLQRQFYLCRKQELAQEIGKLEAVVTNEGHNQLLATLQMDSLTYLKAVLFERWKDVERRPHFEKGVLYRNPTLFLKQYPIVLSSTHSSTSSFGPGTMFDYVLMDEASQVDLSTGSLALTCARNIVVVGDAKQLPNVVPMPTRRALEDLFGASGLPGSLNAARYSFLQSICEAFPQAPQTLLREHYRCHPQIANFFNQKFYSGNLIILTSDKGEENVLSAIRTPPGNHERDRANQREIDIIVQEILPSLKEAEQEVGIIAPYRNQVVALTAAISPRQIEVSTVHRFQGREKDAIVLSTVDNKLTAFSDDANLLNVAVSRARKQLCLVTSSELAGIGSPVGDLLSYIEYNNHTISESGIRSVFDLLYRSYSDARKEYLSRHRRVSDFDSENLMFALLEKLLREPGFDDLDVVCHQPLRWVFRDYRNLTAEEHQYVSNSGTHVDFLIFNRVTKKPILGVEVDGVRYHKLGTAQYRRDRLKDEVFQKNNLKLLRLATNGSGEDEKLREALGQP